jgi:hypothetical protein
MILGFHEHFDAKKTQPTWFREKILLGAGRTIIRPTHHFVHNKKKPGYISHASDVYHDVNPKLHTFRIDSNDRWKPGMSIQMVYRGPKYSVKDHFNKYIPEFQSCISTQKVEIKWTTNKEFFNRKEVSVFVDRYLLLEAAFSNSAIGATHHYRHLDGVVAKANASIDLIAVNDGFNGLFDFFKYFNKDFTGKIIHWTDLRY